MRVIFDSRTEKCNQVGNQGGEVTLIEGGKGI